MKGSTKSQKMDEPTGTSSPLQNKPRLSLVKTPEEVPFKPLFLIYSLHDSPPPYRQIVDMICALKAAGVPDSAYQTLTIPNSAEHSFVYWYSWDGQPCIDIPCNQIVRDVIDFLDAHLK
jgi:hypothetical protein